jgi:hypothetical protein
MSSTPKQDNQSRSARPPPPALNIESPALTQPFKDFVSRGLCTITVKFTPLGTQISCAPGPAIREDGESDDTILPFGVVRDRIEKRGLATVRKVRGQKPGSNNQPQPLKSLTEEDFNGSDEKLITRIRAVATALGPDVARSRVLTHRLNDLEFPDFETWWAAADAQTRALLLTDKKHREKIGQSVSKLTELRYNCPFRGSLSPPTQSDETKKEEKTGPKGKQNAVAGPSTNGKAGGSKGASPKTPPAKPT